MGTDERLLTVAEAARVCNLSKSRMYHIVAGRELPVHIFGRTVRIMPSDLQEYISSRRVYSKNEIERLATDYVAASDSGTQNPGKGREAARPAETKSKNNIHYGKLDQKAV